MSEQQLVPLERDYVLEHKRLSLRGAFRRCNRDHPLVPGWRSAKRDGGADDGREDDGSAEEQEEQQVNDDPLSMMLGEQKKQDFDDPLMGGGGGGGGGAGGDPLSSMRSGAAAASASSALAATGTSSLFLDEIKVDDKEAVLDDAARALSHVQWESWSQKKPRILAKYSTNKRIPVTANFLEENKREANKAVAIDNTESRLEQLEVDTTSEEAKMNLTQKEYIAHIEKQHENLKKAWENGERVLSLKIAIQCAKLLGDTNVPHFYPSMYVLLANILDTFGRLVFERIKAKGTSPTGSGRPSTALPKNFRAADVSLEARETCRNWFYKTACIRELTPRLYIDMALIHCHRFLRDDAFPEILARISKTIRGLGDPLCATYARAYLASKALEISGQMKPTKSLLINPLLEAFDDFLFTFRSLRRNKFAGVRVIQLERIGVDEYIDLFSPALEWLLQMIGYQSREDLFFALLQQYRDYCNNAAVLVHFLASFEPKFVSAHAVSMISLVREADECSTVPKSKLWLTLGKCLIAASPPQNQRLPILNDVWKVVTKIQEPKEYLEIAEVFVEYLLKHFGHREVNIFLKDVIKHAKQDAAYKEHQIPLASIVQTVLKYNADFANTLTMDNFLPLLDLLEKKHKVDASKNILLAFATAPNAKASDPVILHTLLDVSRNLHDSVDSLSFSDERRQISKLIIQFIRKIDFGRDLEKQLSTFVECRQAFTNLDSVTQELVIRVQQLCAKAHRFMKGRHTRKTSAFVKACLAYCHITIPSLDDVFQRLRLFLSCAQVALMNGMVVQAEGFLKATISLIPDVPVTREVDHKMKSTEEDLADFVRNFVSFLVLMPGHPKHGPFYLLKALINAVQAYAPWKTGASPNLARVYIGIVSLCATYFQRTFPYRIAIVESNDRLYGGDDSYLAQLSTYINTLVQELLNLLNQIGQKGDTISRTEQAILALDIVNVIVSSLDMNAHSATLVVKLYQLAQKSGVAPADYLERTLQHIQNKKGIWYQDISQKIVA
eukprot:TRINITY_DN84900_c0_g1_i1.p1 TRINITY_DN84900_c0_g1~~TRINITY_DN84900_c0_g1_i1.p1  ORF type:complete len:1024 (-),score=600.29 TRINITY_DN84900_c0_g1_i1:79-3114(-)